MEEKKDAGRVTGDKKKRSGSRGRERSVEIVLGSVKFEVFGNAMIEKRVRVSGNSGRIYLPPDWVGHNVKIIRID